MSCPINSSFPHLDLIATASPPIVLAGSPVLTRDHDLIEIYMKT